MNNLPRNLVQAIGDLNRTYEKIFSIAKILNEKNLNVFNSLTVIEKAVQEYKEAEREVKARGYKSLACAIYGLKRQTTYHNVPQDMTIAPRHWRRDAHVEIVYFWKDGVEKSKTVTKAGVDAVTAQKNLTRILPILDDVLEGADTEYVQEVRNAFLELSYSDFVTALFDALASERMETIVPVNKPHIIEAHPNHVPS